MEIDDVDNGWAYEICIYYNGKYSGGDVTVISDLRLYLLEVEEDREAEVLKNLMATPWGYQTLYHEGGATVCVEFHRRNELFSRSYTR